MTTTKVNTEEEEMPAIWAESTGSDFELIPEDTYPARAVQIIHLGTVEKEYEGKKRKANEVRITFEIPDVRRTYEKDGVEVDQPAFISKDFTLSMHEKAKLRSFIQAWRGKGYTEEEAQKFNVSVLAGQPVMLGIIHESSKKDASKKYANISSATTVPKKMAEMIPAAETDIIVFGFGNFKIETFKKLPKYVIERVMKSDEFQALKPKDQMAAIAHAETLGKKSEDKPAPVEEDLKFNAPVTTEASEDTDEPPF